MHPHPKKKIIPYRAEIFVLRSSVAHDATLHTTTQHNKAQQTHCYKLTQEYNTTQYNTIQRNKHNTTRHDAAKRNNHNAHNTTQTVTAQKLRLTKNTINYRRRADCMLLVYSVVSRQSWEVIPDVIAKIQQASPDRVVPIMLAGNFADELEKNPRARQVTVLFIYILSFFYCILILFLCFVVFYPFSFLFFLKKIFS